MFRFWFRKRRQPKPLTQKRARLCVEPLETRVVPVVPAAPVISSFLAAPIAGHIVQLSGMVSDESPATVHVQFSGVASGSAVADSTGYFILLAQASALGTVDAVATDQANLSSVVAHAAVTCPPPTVSLAVSNYGVGRTVTLSGQVSGAIPQNGMVTLSGAVNDSAFINADGTFSLTEWASGLGTVQATTVDAWGQDSNVAQADITSTPPTISLAVAYGSGLTVTLSGQVTDGRPQDDTVQFTGVVNSSTSVNPDGTFSLTAQADGLGTVEASTVNDWGLASNTASVELTSNAAALQLAVHYEDGPNVTFYGQVVDVDPTGLSVQLSGAVNDIVWFNYDGTVNITEYDVALGTVNATVVDQNGPTNLSASLDLTSPAPVIDNLQVSYGGGQSVTLSGHVAYQQPEGLYVSFTGGVADGSAYVQADGSFSLTTQAWGYGTEEAATADPWGQASNTIGVDISPDAAAVQLYVSSSTGRTVTLYGQVVDVDPTGMTLILTGVVNDSIPVNWDGTFYVTEDASGLGTVDAQAVDGNENPGPAASVDIVSAVPVINLQLAYGSGQTITLSGQVTDEQPSEMIVTFTGLVNTTAPVNPDGTFSLTTQVQGYGTVEAATVDPWGQSSNTASVDVNSDAMALRFSVVCAGQRMVTLSGEIDDANPSGLSVAFTGVVNDSVAVNPDGTYSLTVQADSPGAIQATTVDPNNLVNLSAGAELTNEAPALNLALSYGAGRTVTLSGQVTDDMPSDDMVTFTGVVQGSVPVNPDGTFTFTSWASGLGTVTASTVDPWGVSSNNATAEVTGVNTSLQLSVTQSGHRIVTISGAVVDADPTGLSVQLSGAFNALVPVQADGTFSVTTQDAALGTVSATVIDPANQISAWNSAEISSQWPSVNLQFAFLGGTAVELYGQVCADNPGGLQVTFSGLVNGSATVNGDGTFSLTANVQNFGSVEACTTDWWGQTSSPAGVDVESDAPYLVVNVVHDSGYQVTVCGTVFSACPQGLTVNIAGVAGGTAVTDADGNFSLTTQASALGYIQASTQDAWGQVSNTAVTEFYQFIGFVGFDVACTHDRTITLWGHVYADDPGNLMVTFTGVADVSVRTDANGDFSVTTQASGLGTVYASAIDIWGQQTLISMIDLSANAPQLSLNVSYGEGRTITLSGSVVDQDQGELTVSLTGCVVAQVHTNADGTFSLTTQATGLGPVTASTVDLWGQASNDATVMLTSSPPVIDQFTAINNGNRWWTFEGHVTAPSPAGMVMQLGGLPSLANATAQVGGGGFFSYVVQLAPNESGVATAQTTDWWGQQSNQAALLL